MKVDMDKMDKKITRIEETKNEMKVSQVREGENF